MSSSDARRAAAAQRLLDSFDDPEFSPDVDKAQVLAEALAAEARAAVDAHRTEMACVWVQYERLSDHKHRLHDEVVRLRAALTLDPETAGRLWIAAARVADAQDGLGHQPWHVLAGLALAAGLRAHAGL